MLLSLTKDLAPLKDVARARVDADAEACRQLWITPGSGQALVYQTKLAEAGGFLAGGDGPFPFLQAGVDAGEAPDLMAEALLVQSRAAEWGVVGAGIEMLRLTAKAAIESATNPGEIDAAVSVDWPKP